MFSQVKINTLFLSLLWVKSCFCTSSVGYQHNQHFISSRNVGVCFSECVHALLMASETKDIIVHCEMSVGMFAQISVGMDLGWWCICVNNHFNHFPCPPFVGTISVGVIQPTLLILPFPKTAIPQWLSNNHVIEAECSARKPAADGQVPLLHSTWSRFIRSTVWPSNIHVCLVRVDNTGSSGQCRGVTPCKGFRFKCSCLPYRD